MTLFSSGRSILPLMPLAMIIFSGAKFLDIASSKVITSVLSGRSYDFQILFFSAGKNRLVGFSGYPNRRWSGSEVRATPLMRFKMSVGRGIEASRIKIMHIHVLLLCAFLKIFSFSITGEGEVRLGTMILLLSRLDFNSFLAIIKSYYCRTFRQHNKYKYGNDDKKPS